MKKLASALRWLDDNLLFLSVAAFTLAVALVPKIPLFHIDYTYIKGRYDDFFILPPLLIYIVQIIRRKNPLRLKFALPIVIFWVAILASCLVGIYVQHTIPIHFQGFLHTARRVQYMLIYFVAISAVTSEKKFMSLMRLYFFGVLAVCLYALGQRFLQFPSIQTMNPAYVDGRVLFLNPEDRLNSTFGGHFDLAAYLVFSIPLIFGFYFYSNKIKYFLLYVLSLAILLYTAARSSFGGYLGSVTLFLLYTRKFVLYLVTVAITVVLLFVTGEMTQRLLQTFQLKTVFVNTTTGSTTIDQEISTKELAAGNLKIKLPSSKNATAPRDQAKINEAAMEEAKNEAKLKGLPTSQEHINRRAAEIAKVLRPEQMILCDISCSTRLQVEWPRAIGAFLYKPVFGTGPSSLGEATDNSFLRWLGEFGIVGTIPFMFLLFSILAFMWKTARGERSGRGFIFYGYVFALLSLLINALYVDAFEASKMAYTLWLVTGLYVGYALTPRSKT